MLKKIIRDQEGSVFIITLMLLVVLSILGTAVMNTTVSNNKMAIYDSEFQSVYYVAEAGVRHVGSSITDSIEDICEESESKTEYFNKIEGCITDAIASFNSGDFSEVRGSQPGVDIILEDVELTDDSKIYTLLSTGDIDGISRQVVQKIEVKYSKSNGILADMAVFADGEINLSGSGKIIGPVGTNLTSPNAINISGGGGVRIQGDCYFPEGADEDALNVADWITKPNIKTTPKRNLILPGFPEFPSFSKLDPLPIEKYGNTYYLIDNDGNLTAYTNSLPSDNYVLEINSNAYIPQFNITENVNLSIKTDTETYLVVDDINVGGKLDIIGNGSITMYVNNSINIEYGDFNLISPDESHIDATEQLTIYYKGTDPLHFGSDIDVFGSLYAETAKITLDNGGGFQGHIFTGSTEPLEIKGNFDAYSRIIYAPFAPVICTASGKVEGSIICKSIDVSGDGEIKFVASDEYADIPFEVKNPGEQNLLIIDPIRER
jgi:Tfp pilus assembly protein PilX